MLDTTLAAGTAAIPDLPDVDISYPEWERRRDDIAAIPEHADSGNTLSSDWQLRRDEEAALQAAYDNPVTPLTPTRFPPTLAAAGAEIAPYLAASDWPPGTKALAVLALTDRDRRWKIYGDPSVTLLAKRLFPGAQGRGARYATFPATPRTMTDLIWFMQRFPIAVLDTHQAAFAAACTAATDHAARRAATNAAASTMTAKPGLLFTGQPRHYQEECLAFGMTNERCLIADDMGLGKTVEAIMLLATANEWPALVVVPPHLLPQWQEKLPEFLAVKGATDAGPLFASPGPSADPAATSGLKLATITSRGTSKEDVRKGRDTVPDAHIILTHYGLLSHWRERFEAAGIRAVVFDEVQDLRHRETDKYNAASVVASSARYVWGLSGTPIYNYGDEMWAIMNILDFQSIGPRDDFIREWCTPLGNGKQLVKDPRALSAYLRREGMMIRRRKTDVANELPPKHRIVHRIDASTGIFRDAMETAIPLLARYDSASRFEKFSLAGRIGDDTRRATGLAKADAAAAFLTTILEAGEPVVIFAHHHDVVDALTERLQPWNPVCMTGRQTRDEKTAAKTAFLDGTSQVMIIALRAATGIDGLQNRARIAVYVELDWSPAVHAQGEDRLHRDGQPDPVLVYYLVCSLGTDPDMEAKLGLKIQQAKGILDDPFESEEDRRRDEEATQSFLSQTITRLRAQFANTKKSTHAA